MGFLSKYFKVLTVEDVSEEFGSFVLPFVDEQRRRFGEVGSPECFELFARHRLTTKIIGGFLANMMNRRDLSWEVYAEIVSLVTVKLFGHELGGAVSALILDEWRSQKSGEMIADGMEAGQDLAQLMDRRDESRTQTIRQRFATIADEVLSGEAAQDGQIGPVLSPEQQFIGSIHVAKQTCVSLLFTALDDQRSEFAKRGMLDQFRSFSCDDEVVGLILGFVINTGNAPPYAISDPSELAMLVNAVLRELFVEPIASEVAERAGALIARMYGSESTQTQWNYFFQGKKLAEKYQKEIKWINLHANLKVLLEGVAMRYR